MNNKIKIFIKRSGLFAFGLMLMLSLIAASVPAQKWTPELEQINEGRNEANDARKVFREIMSKPDQAIPRELLENATAVGVFPNVVKAAFIFGGRGGDGVVARRPASGDWGVPVFYNMGGASFGAQIGAKSTDYVILFMNEGGLRDLLDDKLEFEGSLSFAAGPVGRTVGAGTNLTLDAGILTYSRSKGAFVGASIKGAVLTADNSINEALYKMRGGDVLGRPEKSNYKDLPRELDEFMKTLANYGGTGERADNSFNQPIIKNVSYTPPNKNMALPRSNEQRKLAREIRKELLMMPYYSVFDWIEFEVDRNGIVTLRGFVTTPPDKKSSAQRRVGDVEGVTEVKNEIEILPLSPNDDRLRRKLYQTIYSGPLFRYQVGALQQIHIIVGNGKVTLEGVVDSDADRNIAGIRANTLAGVFSVDNRLLTQNNAP